MNIFITGVNSFVGKNLINQFKQYPKHKIYGCDLIINKKNKSFVKADIRSKNFYKKIPKKIDAIIHLAAISRDKDCSDDLINCYLTNIIGTLNVIEAAKKLNIPKEKLLMNMLGIGNTSSSSIPIVLSKYLDKIPKNKKILLIGFGGGLSWGISLISR